jgi:3-oxoacyl-[acyl-carrier-protein] synthase II
MSVAFIAFGAVSALGEGGAAVSAGDPGESARVVLAKDPVLEAAGLARPFAARASSVVTSEGGDRATALLLRALEACQRDLDRTVGNRWKEKRIGLAVGTSSGALASAEEIFARRRRTGLGDVEPRLLERGFYFAPVLGAARVEAIRFSPATLILGACAASAIAMGIGKRWLEAGECDVVLAGGFDAVAVLVAAGFEVLRATTGSLPPRPFRQGRDGMALGEGAALVAMVRAGEAPSGAARAYLTGFGASSDAVHLTAPDRTGSGLARAAAAALDEAGRPDIDLVSAHGTATPFSDAAEARALQAVLGPKVASEVVVHPFKAQIGHTLGAAGVLEALACVDAIERGVFPAAAGGGTIDPDTPVCLLDRAVAGHPRTALKLSAAFGGANAALVLSKAPLARPALRLDPARKGSILGEPPFVVYVSRAVHVMHDPIATELASRIGQPIEKVGRGDLLTRLALSAVAELVRAHGGVSDSGIVVGEAFGTLETDATFHARIEDRGARMAEPRRFPYTSPNASAGECSVAFGLTGPSFAVGCGPCAGLEALAIAGALVRSGDARRMVVVAVDAVGEAVRATCARLGLEAETGATALILSREPEYPHVLRETSLTLGPWSGPGRATGHRALVPLVGAGSMPVRLEAGGPLVRPPSSLDWAVLATAQVDGASSRA